MRGQRDYLGDAIENEEVFRNILRRFPADFLKSQALDPEASLKDIYDQFSTGDRYAKWTILDFRKGPSNEPLLQLAENEVMFSFEDIACLSGSGSTNVYKVNPDNSVDFVRRAGIWMS